MNVTMDRKTLWDNIYEAKTKVEENIQLIDELNSNENCNILSGCYSEVQNSLEHLNALKTAQNSKINAFVKGCFKMLGGSLGLLALGVFQIPVAICTCLDPYYFTILPGYSALASMVREGAFSFSAAFKDKTEINEEISKKTDALNSHKDKITEFFTNRGMIITLFKEIQKNVKFIEDNEKKVGLKISKSGNSELLNNVTSKTISWNRNRIGICLQNSEYLELTDKLHALLKANFQK